MNTQHRQTRLSQLGQAQVQFFLLIFLLILTMFLGEKAQAFPDMVRHGYTTCMTCHFSHSGGGLLTSYGKFIAGELFGRYNTSEDALPWLVEPVENPKFTAGVLTRAAQTYFDNASVRKAQFRRMQLDVEAVSTYESFIFSITGGMKGSAAKPGENEMDLKLRSAYVTHYSLSHAVRIGKFFPEFGLRHPNHNIPTRKGLYWNQGDEPQVVQASYYTKTFDLNLGWLKGEKNTQLSDKTGYFGTFGYKTETTRSGMSYLKASDKGENTSTIAGYTQLGYQKHGYTLIEYAKKIDTQTGSKDVIKNLVFIESGWEVTKGVIPYIGMQRTHIETSSSTNDALPLGLRFYPWTHVELIAEAARTSSTVSGSTTLGTAAFLMMNAYF